jgi:hypothetical protein
MSKICRHSYVDQRYLLIAATCLFFAAIILLALFSRTSFNLFIGVPLKSFADPGG